MYSIDKENLENQSGDVEVLIHPISKWKRILFYLGEMMISFMAAIVLMNVAVMPLATLISPISNKESIQAEKNRDDILYNYNLLFYHTEEDDYFPKYDFDSNLVYTTNRFVGHYLFTDGDTSYVKYQTYTRLDNGLNEVVWTYYHKILHDDITYFNLFEHYNRDHYFSINKNVVTADDLPDITLDPTLYDELRYFNSPTDEMGSLGKKYYSSIKNTFLSLFGEMIEAIKKNDLTSDIGGIEYSFIDCTKIMNSISDRYYLRLTVCCIISYVLAWLLLHIIYPLISKANHTPLMSIMRVERIGINNLKELSKGEAILSGVYFLFFDIVHIAFLTLSYITIDYLAHISILLTLSIVGFAVILIDLIVLLVSRYNRSLTDFMSKTVIVPTEEMDSIIKAQEELREERNMRKHG